MFPTDNYLIVFTVQGVAWLLPLRNIVDLFYSLTSVQLKLYKVI